MYGGIFDTVGRTPLVYVEEKESLNIYVKYEGKNPTGSIKDRAAIYVVNKMLDTKKIDKDTEIIESSSGNFGIALSAFCKHMGLNCTIVIDPNILPINEFILSQWATTLTKVTERDSTGGFLLTRIGYIKEKLKKNDNVFWVNQYKNKDVAEAYYATVGEEICDEIRVDYIFIGVSSGGTITGISNKVKERYPNAKVIAVDVEGSVVFGNTPQKRYIPGVGSSMKPDILQYAKIDDVVIVKESDSIKECWKFMKKYEMLIGGSSGSVYCAIEKYFRDKNIDKKQNVVALFADCGERYMNTVYNKEWVKQHFDIDI